MKARSSWYVVLVLTALLFGGAIFLQGRMIQRFRDVNNPDIYRYALYVPSEGYLKTAAIGYDQFFADFFWLRMIQLFAAGWTRPENAEQQWSYFNGITDLDPRFVEVYTFAIMAVGESGGRHDMVQAIADKAVRNMPMHWEIPRDAAFYAFWQMNDPKLARYYVQLALQAPDHPDYLSGWVGFFSVKEGRFQAAFQKYMIDIIKSKMSGGNKDFDGIYMIHLRRAVDEWFKSVIQTKAVEWKKAKGTLPTLEELKQSGAFSGIEMPDWGAVRGFLQQLESGNFKPASEDEIRKFTGNFIRKWDNLPPEAPYDSEFPKYQGYVVWPVPTDDKKQEYQVISAHRLIVHYQDLAAAFQELLPDYKAKHNGQCPTDPVELLPTLKNVKDPLGGTFGIDQATCKFTVSSVPDLYTAKVPYD